MKSSCMTDVLKKLSIPMVVCGALWLGSAAEAQVGVADIVSISTTPGSENTTELSVGVPIEIKFGMWGQFAMTNALPGPYQFPQLRMVVNGENSSFAQMTASPSYNSASARTYFTFWYTVKPGDMAAPLKIYGLSGGSSAGDSYDIVNNGYRFYNAATGSNLVWRFNPTGGSGSDVYDLDFTMVAKRTLKTLSFVDALSPVTVAATESTQWRVTTQNAVAGNVVSFYAWPLNTNLVRVGSVPGQKALLVNIPVGATTADFPITGLATGTTEIVLQRVNDYNPLATLPTNYVSRTITVTVPPEPTVKVMFSGADTATMDESSSGNTGSLTIELSQTFAQDVWVRLTTTPAGQNNLTLVPYPYAVRVPAGSLSSSVVPFSLPDGTVTSLLTGIVISPEVTNAAAASVYTRMKTGTVYVRNVKPVILQPLATDTPTATRGEPFAFNWSVSDVPADVASGMTLTWNFGDGTANEIVSNAAGSVYHTYATPAVGTGTKTVKVTAKDKDGTVSDEVQFTVTVVQPLPKPSLRVVPASYLYGETTTNATGLLNLVLSEAFTEDVWVSLTATLNGLAQSNLVLATTNAIKISRGDTSTPSGITFSTPDGTLLSETSGIDIIPTVTNALARAYYTDVRSANVRVQNVRPRITKPLAGSLPVSYANVPLGTAFSYNWTVVDVPADGPTLSVSWVFDNGITQITRTGTNLTGTVSVALPTLGPWTVTVQASDKDGGVSDESVFTVMVTPPSAAPNVMVVPPAGPLEEGTTGSFIVRLSEAFTNDMVVRLNVTPVNSAANGSVSFNYTQFTIPAGYTEQKVPTTLIVSAQDGTAISRDTGFTVTPVVLSPPAASNAYALAVSGVINVLNVAPLITTPAASSNVVTIAQGSPYTFFWNIKDVALDLPTMNVTWWFGDGASQTFISSAGTVTHVYSTIGDMTVRVVATDKDGDSMERLISITVRPTKQVTVTPIGPNLEASYWGAAGLGNGKVFSTTALSTTNRNNVYFFNYHPDTVAATLEAVPYKANLTGYTVINYDNDGNAVPGVFTLFDSFFYVWVGGTEGDFASARNLVPATANPAAAIALPAAQTGATPTTGVAIREVQAIFSREFRQQDNMGDINLDGIPDKIAQRYGLPQLANGGAAATATGVPADLLAVNDYNGDLDFLPGAATDGDLITGFLYIYATVGDPFTALLEVRGFNPGLNNLEYNSEPDGPRDEPGATLQKTGGTDPTKADTDGDQFPDGWEYYFWYNATFKGMAGSAYDPLDVAVGIPIDWKSVALAFDPLVPATDPVTGSGVKRDIDNDGLKDIEELAMGTNPINWDTDGDGMCDGWEVMRGLNPNDPRDGLLTAMNNPDGDHMAFRLVPRQFVTEVLDSGSTTNTYLTTNTVAAGAMTGSFTTWYRYGGTNAQIAVGRPITNATVNVAAWAPIEALILHFQVYQEIGFDPRTAWETGDNRPNTRPFTSVDEYLLLKFMAEVQLNGTNTPSTRLAWTGQSTDPLTPDSDASASASDGMPDGWELYAACGPTLRVMAINPWDPLDGLTDADNDLVNQREFAGFDSVAGYANAALYQNTNNLGNVTIVRPVADLNWTNKRWPTDPWDKDTDDDTLSDAAEVAFMYGNAAGPGAGGGLNPCSMDTDGDALPDPWELEFAGTPVAAIGVVIPPVVPGTPATPVAMTITDGMDGTVGDAYADPDFDGLLNYQEYWVQAVRGFRYDITDLGTVSMFDVPGLPMDETFDPVDLFTMVTKVWDTAFSADPPFFVMLPVGTSMRYVSTDPTNPDTDQDGMDDFYEMFHGLNPILGLDLSTELVTPVTLLGDRVARAHLFEGYPLIIARDNDWNPSPMVPLPMDFVSYPWLAGLLEADPDADGLRNFEEMLYPNMKEPAYSNTDPSPLWLTDASTYESLVTRFYTPSGAAYPPPPQTVDLPYSVFYWPADLPPAYVYNFEMNEGYDTDNDGVSDKSELMQTATTQSDPQDHDDPMRRQALWFSGNNSAAQTRGAFTYSDWSFRSFTVEMWVRPEVSGREQVLLERPIVYGPSDLSVAGSAVRVNFRVGITEQGQSYAMFQNAGLHDSHTGVVKAYGRVLVTNQWVHLSARMDGVTGMFQLLENGSVVDSVPTQLIPANGAVITLTPEYIVTAPAILVLGAANLAPSTPLSLSLWDAGQYDRFFQGYIDEVRVWDGARTTGDIWADYTKRYTRIEDMEYGHIVADVAATNAHPQLMYHYTFDNLFSADSADAVAQVPRGFNDPQASINRPFGQFTVVGWWDAIPVHSTVYADYGIVPWIENSIGHLPQGVVIESTNGITFEPSTVLDSVFYTHTSTGANAATNVFPDSNNPYGMWYETYLPERGFYTASDLLPLGGAWAKQTTSMWDNGSPSGNWAETGADTDSDGLPDWWEALYGLNPLSGEGANGWYGLFYDGSGMTNGERYLRDIAKGMTMNHQSLIGGIVQTSDMDGDGMPDWWEDLFGLSPFSALDKNGALGDLDIDGLSNYAEYMISETYGFRMSRPSKFRTQAEQPESDYFQKPVTNSPLYLGELFADHDFMEDSWEDAFAPAIASRFVYDPHLDPDQDGWSNWAEDRYGSAPASGETNAVPLPTLELHLAYSGQSSLGTVVIQAYSSPDMRGTPDAVYTPAAVTSWPATVTVDVPSAGHMVEGMNYFFAILDLNGNGTWDDGEPCGVSDGFGVGVGWDRNVVSIEMTDSTPSFLRTAVAIDAGAGAGVAAPGIQEARVRVRRKTIDGNSNYQTVVLDTMVQSTRPYIHEGDFFAKGEFGLDWGLVSVPTTFPRLSIIYDLYLGDDAVLTNAFLTLTNTFDSVRAKAAQISPINGGYVYSARPVFKWSMPRGYTAFTLEIRKGSSGGTLMYSSGTVMAPVRDKDGNCIWTAPIYAGNRIPSTGQVFVPNTAYAWRLTAQNAKFSNTTTDPVWSDWKLFRLDVNSPLDSSGYGALQARVKYYGPATNLLSNRVRVQAFRNRGFAGLPECEYTLTAADLAPMVTPAATNVNAVLRGLTPSRYVGDYYLRAYIDSNTNGVRDVWESWGYANYYGVDERAYDVYPLPVEYKPATVVYDIRIEDADSDQDWYPDAWEYQQNPGLDFLNLTGPWQVTNPNTIPDTEINPFLQTNSLGRASLALFSAPMALMTSDADGDGLGDMTELILGSNPNAASTAGDGFTDGAKLGLGLAPADYLTVNVTGLSLGQSGASLQWYLAVQKASADSRVIQSLAPGAAAYYAIQHKAALSDPEWTTVQTGPVTLNGLRADKLDVNIKVDTAQGFFRVLLKNP